MLQEPHLAGSTLEQRCAEACTTAAELNNLTSAWHATDARAHDLVEQLHHANFTLWHLEDEARDTQSGDAAIASIKRHIDRANQLRNDTVEQIDLALLASLKERSLPSTSAPLHSETPGQMLDRISILSLKIFHTAQEAHREDADEQHRRRNRLRLQDVTDQQRDLGSCLESLWQEVLAGHKRFKLYRQHKMYNDPALNPILYRKSK